MSESAGNVITPIDGNENHFIRRFGRGFDSDGLLQSGWGEPEDGFIWTEGKASKLMLPVFAGRNRIVLSVWGYAPASCPAQDVMIFIDGLMKGIFAVSGQTLIEIVLENAGGNKDAELLLYIPSALSPAKAEGYPDDRQLGVALSVIDVSGPRAGAADMVVLKNSGSGRR